MAETHDTLESRSAMIASYDWHGRELIDQESNRVGVVAALYAHGESDAPAWAAVRTGLFGMKETFVPITAAQPAGERVRVPFGKDQIREAPRIEPDGELTPDEASALYRHYEMESPSAGSEESTRAPGAADSDTERGTSAMRRPGDDDAMTRSEEEIDVSTASRERGRVRLRKVVVTEQVRERVPVEREEARIEREPITDENVDAATAGPEISPAEHEVVLHEDVPVVEKRVVPKERVRLDKDTHTDEEQVSEQVRKERIEAEGELDR